MPTCVILIFLILSCIFYPAKTMQHSLPSRVWLTPINLPVQVVSLVKQQPCYASFVIQPLQQSYYFQASWFSCNHIKIHVGDILDVSLRLKPLHALNNPGGFDTLQWARQNNIVAQATLKSAKKIGDATGIIVAMQRLREQLDEITHLHLQDQAVISVIEAVTLGIKSNVEWDLMQKFNLSGTRHLLAISGAHLAIITLFVYAGFFCLLRGVIILFPRVNAHLWAMILAMPIVGFYVVLCGEQVPTLRALWMTLVGVMAIFLHRYSSLIGRIITAAAVVIAMDPENIYSASFYLSFYAVFLMAYHQLWLSTGNKKWRTYLQLNLLLLLGLLPLSLFFFSQFSFMALLSNIIAIPLLGFIILPVAILLQWLTFFGCHCHFLWFLLEQITQSFLWMITFFAKVAVTVPGLFVIGHLSLISALLLSILLLIAFLPQGMPGKWLCSLVIIPTLLMRAEPPQGSVQIVFLNVGQGLAVLVKTHHHLLVYDTGPKFFSGGDVGQSVIIPYFYYRGWKKADLLMVSHGDADHSGGVSTLRKNVSIAKILTSAVDKIPGSILCQRGQRWQWDGVVFTVLYPDASHQHQGNNSSCVLKISAGKNSALLTGDIEHMAEHYLSHNFYQDLSSTVLSVPHHGSKTSSSIEFLLAAHPLYAVFSYGFLNRFHFPHAVVMQRYNQYHIEPWVTEFGPVFIEMTPSAVAINR